jgi:hypothetical protein
MCMFCRSLFVLLSFFFWPLRCQFFFDISSSDTEYIGRCKCNYHTIVATMPLVDEGVLRWVQRSNVVFLVLLFHSQICHVINSCNDVVLCVCFVDRCLSFCPFSFCHWVVSSSSIYEFLLPLWYLQTLFKYCWTFSHLLKSTCDVNLLSKLSIKMYRRMSKQLSTP